MWFLGLPMFVGVAWLTVGALIAAKEVLGTWSTLSRRQKLLYVTTAIGFVIFVAAFINFTLFWMIAVAIGGDADAIEGERYYVSSHGHRTEVSRAVWTYSYYHTRSTWITHPLGMAAIGIVLLAHRILGPKPVALQIVLDGDGKILVDGKEVSLDEVVRLAVAARDRREPIRLHHAYLPDAVPDEAVTFHRAFIEHGLLFEVVPHTAA